MNKRDPVIVEAVLNLRATGLSSGLIADALGYSEPYVAQVIVHAKRYGDTRASTTVIKRKSTHPAHDPYECKAGVLGTVITTIVPARLDERIALKPRHILQRQDSAGVVPFGEPEPGRSALDKRRASSL